MSPALLRHPAAKVKHPPKLATCVPRFTGDTVSMPGSMPGAPPPPPPPFAAAAELLPAAAVTASDAAAAGLLPPEQAEAMSQKVCSVDSK
eukprot:scaffold113909_cov60-Phaeocystis_antarctica.AAC.1